jgi:hypothetical protein
MKEWIAPRSIRDARDERSPFLAREVRRSEAIRPLNGGNHPSVVDDLMRNV